MKSKTTKQKSKSKKISVDAGWEAINPHAAGVDIGAREHWACVPAKSSPTPVRKFGTFTADLEAMAKWFKECGVTTVAMETSRPISLVFGTMRKTLINKRDFAPFA